VGRPGRTLNLRRSRPMYNSPGHQTSLKSSRAPPRASSRANGLLGIPLLKRRSGILWTSHTTSQEEKSSRGPGGQMARAPGRRSRTTVHRSGMQARGSGGTRGRSVPRPTGARHMTSKGELKIYRSATLKQIIEHSLVSRISLARPACSPIKLHTARRTRSA